MPDFLPEEIAQHYSACMDSVNLIDEVVAKPMKTAEDIATLDRNSRHLQIMIPKTFWTVEDMTPLNAAIAAAAPFI